MLSRQYNITFQLLNPLRISAVVFCALLCLLTSFIAGSVSASQPATKIIITHQHTDAFHSRLIEQVKLDLTSQGYQANSYRLSAESSMPEAINTADLVIAVGSKTTKQLLDAKLNQPMLSVLIPRHLAHALRKSYPRQKQWSNLLIDQPLERQFHLISAILGKQQKAGILLGPYTKNMKPLLQKAARKTRHQIIAEQVDTSEQLMTSLQKLNQQSNVLMTLPDPMIYNQNTIRGILLSSYRNKVPIIGFSRAYVKAGAIAAIYSEPTQISQQMASIINDFILQGKFSRRYFYPVDFSVALNTNVANSLGISLDSSAAIIRRIKKAEQ